MRDCPTCGHSNPEGAAFCGECGRRLPTGQVCDSCNYAGNLPEATYCVQCGAPLQHPSFTRFIWAGGAAAVLIAAVILWQVGLLEKWVTSVPFSGTEVLQIDLQTKPLEEQATGGTTIPTATTPKGALSVSLTNTPTQQISDTAESSPVADELTTELTNTPTVRPTDTPDAVNVMLCTRSDFDGSVCSSARTVFPPDTEAVYASWQLSDGLTRRSEFTRRWYKDGMLLLEGSNSAGENARWTPSDGRSYYVYLSATEGTGKRLFGSESLPAGNYTIELLVDDRLANTTQFVVQ